MAEIVTMSTLYRDVGTEMLWLRRELRNTHELWALAHYLLGGKAEGFDLSVWGHYGGCGYAGCAIGHLPHAFPDTRLELQDGGPDIGLVPVYAGLYGKWAVGNYFGLSRIQFLHLFSSVSYESDNPSQQEVGQRLLDFLIRCEVAPPQDDKYAALFEQRQEVEV